MQRRIVSSDSNDKIELIRARAVSRGENNVIMMKGEKVINEKQLGVVMMNLILTLEKFSVSNALSAYERN